MTAPTTKPASDKQRNLIVNLCTERGLDVDATVAGRFGEDVTLADLTGGRDGQASDLITHLFSIKGGRKATDGTTKGTPAEGFYRVDTDIVRVQVSKSGNWYAKLAKTPVNESRRSLDWDYLGKRINLEGAVLLSQAEAGKYLGYCVRCNAPLTDPESIERGMGPTCATKV